MILKAILLCSLYKLLLSTESPLLSAGIYGTFYFILALIGGSFIGALITATLGFAITFGYFTLLNKTQDGLGHYLIMFIGLPICIII